MPLTRIPYIWLCLGCGHEGDTDDYYVDMWKKNPSPCTQCGSLDFEIERVPEN